MEVFEKTIDVKSRTAPIHIDFMGDIHIGSKNASVEKFEEALENNRKKGAYLVIMGDVADAITPSDKRYDREDVSAVEFVYNGVKWDMGSLDGALAFIEKSLEPVAKDGRLLGIHYGNHCGKVYIQTTCNITKGMAARLKTTFMGYMAMWKLNLRYKKKIIKTLNMFTWHGGGGATTPSGVVGVHERLRKSFAADLYVTGHYHQLITFSRLRLESDGEKTVGRFAWHGCSGSFLRSYIPGVGGYAEKCAYDPLSVGFLRATIVPEKGVVSLDVVDMYQLAEGV